MKTYDVDAVVLGAGIAGIAAAYYLCARQKRLRVLLLDERPPMTFTSAQSGDNYRNWWPHPVMADFANDSIDLMEKIAVDTNNAISMTRRGYALATRNDSPDKLLHNFDDAGLRVHQHATTYPSSPTNDWQAAPGGIDVLTNPALIQSVFPAFADDIANVVHIRRAGDFSSQQLAQHMLQSITAAGGTRLQAKLITLQHDHRYRIEAHNSAGTHTITADTFINAAGPFAGDIAALLNVQLPLVNVLQQKLLFEDNRGVVPRQQPFSIDLDTQQLKWTAADQVLLADDAASRWLTEPIAGGVHCRPEGGNDSRWVKLGWAYNSVASYAQSEPHNDEKFDTQFAEIVIRGAMALQPAFAGYLDEFPANRFHYAGYYTMTPENWPLIGPLDGSGAFMICGLSGFGSMAACAAGSLCAAWASGDTLPAYAQPLSLARYNDPSLIAALRQTKDKGLL